MFGSRAEKAERCRCRLLKLTALTGIPFLVCGGSCPDAYGDHLIVSDGKEWHHSEALHESNYPAVRVEYGGVIQDSEVDDARKYWMVYSAALAAIKRAALKRPSAQSAENKTAEPRCLPLFDEMNGL